MPDIHVHPVVALKRYRAQGFLLGVQMQTKIGSSTFFKNSLLFTINGYFCPIIIFLAINSRLGSHIIDNQ